MGRRRKRSSRKIGVKGRSSDPLYRSWKRDVKKRDKCCVLCGSKKRLAAHHKNSWSYFPELRYSLSNGISLCGKCHARLHCDFRNSYRVKQTDKDFANFVKLATYFINVGVKQEKAKQSSLLKK